MRFLASLMLPIVVLLFQALPVRAEGPAVQSIEPQQVKQVLTDYLAEQSAQLPGVELSFIALDLPEALEVPQGRLEFEVIPAKPEVIGSRRLTLLTRVDNQVVSNQSLRVELAALAEVAVLAANLQRGDLLSADNVALEKIDITDLKLPVFNPTEVYGQRLKRSLRLGQPLELSQIEFPPLVKRGDRVEIQLQTGGLFLTAVGEARQDGRAGDTIRVMNSNSRREILCRVVAPGRVSVEL